MSKAQSAVEFLITYGWALILLIIVLSLLYFFLQIPQKTTAPTCQFQQALLCTDLNLGTYVSTGGTVLTFYMNNQQTYPLSNPRATASYSNNNYSGSCYPTYVPAGGRFMCQVSLGITSKLGQFLGGSIYIAANNCGLSSGFLATGNCTGAPVETFMGEYSGHTEAPISFYAYVSDNTNALVYVINLGNNTVTNTIGIPAVGYGVAASPFSGFVYVAYNGGGVRGVAVINTSTHTVVNTITIGGPKELALSPYGSYLYADSGNTLYTISGTNDTVINTLTSACCSMQSVSLSPNGRYIFLGGHSSNTIEIVNSKSYAISNSVSTGSVQPYWLVSAPYSSYLYFIGDTTTTASVMNTNNDVVTNSVSVGANPEGISVTPDGNLEFVSNQGASTVSVINTTNNVVVKTITVGSNPQGSQTSLFGTYTYVTNQNSGSVSVINTSSFTVVNTITLPGAARPYGIAFAIH